MTTADRSYYDWQVQSQPSSQFSQQSHSQLQSGQPAQQSAVQQPPAEEFDVLAIPAAARTDVIANPPSNFVNIANSLSGRCAPGTVSGAV
jgi:hypothetical protein